MVKQWLKQKIDEMENLMSFDNRDPVFLIDPSGKMKTQSLEERKASLLIEAELEKNSLAGGDENANQQFIIK